jgi:hypothetical protein
MFRKLPVQMAVDLRTGLIGVEHGAGGSARRPRRIGSRSRHRCGKRNRYR